MTTRFFYYLILIFLVFIIGLIKFKRVGIAYKILTLLIGVTFLSECISRVLIIKIHNSIPVYHFFSPVEFIGFSCVYYYLIKNSNIRNAILCIMAVMLLGSVIDTLFFETLMVFPSKYLLVCEILYLLYSLLGFRQMLLSPVQTPLYKQSLFWLNTAFLIYTSTIFLSFGLHDYFIKHHVSTKTLNTLIYVVNIIFYSLLGVSIITNKRLRHE
jgi:hypothetical protein